MYATSLLREAGGGKPARAGSAGDAAAKKRPAEALFAALRPHVARPRTCSRTPTPSVARGHALIKLKIKNNEKNKRYFRIHQTNPLIHKLVNSLFYDVVKMNNTDVLIVIINNKKIRNIHFLHQIESFNS